jgi:hypothetical protein
VQCGVKVRFNILIGIYILSTSYIKDNCTRSINNVKLKFISDLNFTYLGTNKIGDFS